VSLLSCDAAGCGESEFPGVLLVVLDTARADRCSFLGYDRPTTPRLEEFARDAVVFAEAWSPASWTAPAHASLFTGLHPERHRLGMGFGDVLGAGPTTLAESLRGIGYATAAFSNNPHVASEFGLLRGFGEEVALHRRRERSLPLARETHAEVAEWIEARRRERRPWFAFVNHMEPHVPRDPDAAATARFLRPGLPAASIERARRLAAVQVMTASIGLDPFSADDLAALSDLYDAQMHVLDAELGAFLDSLRATGALDRTLVVVTSDHGEGLGDHGWLAHAVRLDRELLRVPLLVRLPGTFEGGRVVRDVVRLEDVMPTVLRACGLTPPPGLDGESLEEVRPDRVAWARERPYRMVAAAMRRAEPGADVRLFLRGRRSIFETGLHLVEEEESPPRLYDTRADPLERVDLAATRPEDVVRLVGKLDALTPW